MSSAQAIIELNDQDLRIWHNDQTRASTGFAVFTDEQLLFGDEAREVFRLHPRSSNHTYWQQLGLDPLANPTGSIQHSADLAYHQLQRLTEGVDDQVIFSLPGDFSDQQVSLLLGICQSLSITVPGVVNCALADCAHLADGKYQHIGLYLHQCLVTEIEIVDRIARVISTRVVPGCGRSQLNDKWVRALSEQFINQTRFNPRHSAEDEQYLYNNLQLWSQKLATGESQLQVSDYSIKLSIRTLINSCQELLQPLVSQVENLDGSIVLANNADSLRDLIPAWATALTLAADEGAKNIAQYRQQIAAPDPDNGAQYVDYLQLQSQSIALQGSAPEQHRAEPAPTHVMAGGRVFPINDIWLDGKEPKVMATNSPSAFCQLCVKDGRVIVLNKGDACWLNDTLITEPQPLSPGDVVSNGRQQYTLLVMD